MNAFTASEIIAFAARIHENGAHFYKYAIQLVQNSEAKDLFFELADEEMKHKEKLDKIFAGMEQYIPQESYQGEYARYLRNYIDNNVAFTKNAIDSDLAAVRGRLLGHRLRRPGGSSIRSSTTKASSASCPNRATRAIDDLIAEERRHYVQLTNLRHCVL